MLVIEVGNRRLCVNITDDFERFHCFLRLSKAGSRRGSIKIGGWDVRTTRSGWRALVQFRFMNGRFMSCYLRSILIKTKNNT